MMKEIDTGRLAAEGGRGIVKDVVGASMIVDGGFVLYGLFTGNPLAVVGGLGLMVAKSSYINSRK